MGVQQLAVWRQIAAADFVRGANRHGAHDALNDLSGREKEVDGGCS